MVIPPRSVQLYILEAPLLTTVVWQWPVRLRLHFSRLSLVDRGYRSLMKRDAVSHKHLGYNRHSFANESVTRNFAALPDRRPLLDFDKSTNLRVVSDLTPIEVDERENSLRFDQA